MKTKFAIACLVAGALVGPTLAIAAEDADADRATPVVYVKNSAITTKIKTQLAMEHPTSLAKIHVDTDKDGVVYLSGTARTPEAIDQAMSIARGTENVKSVTSTITVKLDD